MPTRNTFPLALIAFLLPQILSAAVDCKSPQGAQERVVCGNSDLLDLDRRIDSLFEKAFAVYPGTRFSNPASELERFWNRDRGGCGSDGDCLRSAYKEHITNIEAYLQAAEERKKQNDESQKRKAAAAATDAAQADAALRFETLTLEKQRLISTLQTLKEFGPVPDPPQISLPRSRRYIGGERQNQIAQETFEKVREIEGQLIVLHDLLTQRQVQGLDYAKKVLQTVRTQTPAVSELSNLVATAGSSSDGGFKAYQAAKNLEAAIVALNASKQRAEQVIKIASANVGRAAKYSGDKEITATAKTTAQIMNEVSVKIQSTDPRDEGQISQATRKLTTEQDRLGDLIRQAEVLGTGLGKRVYEGCTAWAKRTGTMVSDAPVQIFKDAETNKAADFASNYGRTLCRCMTAEIAGDSQITDEAKIEIAHQFETRNRMSNQALAGIVAVAGSRCQVKGIDYLSGGALSRPR